MRTLLLLIAAVIFFDCHAARADWHVAVVQCDPAHNRVLIRFGMNGGYYSELPAYLINQWKNIAGKEIPPSKNNECQFENGQKIIVSISVSQESNGSGGGDVDGYLNMMINGHTIYNGTKFYQGHGISIYEISGLQYDGTKLLLCNPHETNDHMGSITADPECNDIAIKLNL